MIAITGATGQTGSKIANLLLNNGQKIRVIGRSENKLKPFKERGAEIAVGNQDDIQFLTNAFRNSNAVYLLIPPKMDVRDIREYYNLIGDTSIEAIIKSGVKKVVFLSSMGAELNSGTGPVLGLYDIESKLGRLTDVDLAILRPAFFMENFLANIPLIKHEHINSTTMPKDVPFVMISTIDIAKKVAEHLTSQSFTGHNIIELFGDRLSYREITRLIGEAIGIPDLPYVQASDAVAFKNMTGMGVSENMANSLIEMTGAIGKGLIHPTMIDPLKPNTNTNFQTFVNEVFKPAYQNAD